MEELLFPEHEWDYVNRAVERVKLAWGFHRMMNPDGRKMLLAFSGGKDSICLFFVCKRASEELGIPMEQMFHVQYNITCVDPPPPVGMVREGNEKGVSVHHHPSSQGDDVETDREEENATDKDSAVLLFQSQRNQRHQGWLYAHGSTARREFQAGRTGIHRDKGKDEIGSNLPRRQRGERTGYPLLYADGILYVQPNHRLE